MPLVWEVTDQLRPLLSRETLLRRRPQFNGARVPEVILEELAGLASRPEQHYESLLGHLETEFRRPTNPLETQRHYSGLYVWLVECVSRILVRRHVADAEYLRQNLRFLSGIKHFAAHNSPLWVFSLNHDLVVECLAAEHGISVNSGFGREVTALPRRDARGRKQGEPRAAVLSASALENSRWSFAPHGAPEINLLKIHGALDVFAFRDGLDFLKLLPYETSATGLIDMLRAANEEVIYVDPRTQRQPSATNEIAYADDAGEMQFLRRSLLSALPANVRETPFPQKFSVEGEPASSREFSIQLPRFPCPDRSDSEGQATHVHRRVQAAGPTRGRGVRSWGGGRPAPS